MYSCHCGSASFPKKCTESLHNYDIYPISLQSHNVSMVVYLQSELGTTKLDTCLSLEATRADSDFPSFKVKEFFLWESCSLDISSEAENLRRSWSTWWVRDERFPPVVEVSTMSLPSTSSGTESSMICSGSAGRSKISLWLRFGSSGT